MLLLAHAISFMSTSLPAIPITAEGDADALYCSTAARTDCEVLQQYPPDRFSGGPCTCTWGSHTFSLTPQRQISCPTVSVRSRSCIVAASASADPPPLHTHRLDQLVRHSFSSVDEVCSTTASDGVLFATGPSTFPGSSKIPSGAQVFKVSVSVAVVLGHLFDKRPR